MTQILNIIKDIGELQNSIYVSERDEPRIRQVCESVYEIAKDKDSFLEKSTDMLNALSENNLSEAGKQKWLGYVSSIFAAYLAVKLYEEQGKVQAHLSCEELELVLDFFLNGDFGAEVISGGYMHVLSN